MSQLGRSQELETTNLLRVYVTNRSRDNKLAQLSLHIVYSYSRLQIERDFMCSKDSACKTERYQILARS